MVADQEENKQVFQISTSFGNESFSGFTQYELDIPIISEDGELQIATGHSRLRFPYSSYLTGGTLNFSYYGFGLSIGYWDQYRSQVDKYFEDFDWLTSGNDYQLLAYGRAEPNPDVTYWKIDFSYSFEFYNLRLRPQFQYHRVNSEFRAAELEQIWYVDLEDGSIYDPPREKDVSGNVLYYEQDLDLPYFALGIGYEVFPDNFGFELVLGGTFLAKVEDYDNHLIRSDSLEAWNSGDFGRGVYGGLNLFVNVFEAFWVGLELAYRDYIIDTDGLQRYLNDEGEFVLAATDTEVRGLARSLKVTVSYLFGL
jgi:hypothetical protein